MADLEKLQLEAAGRKAATGKNVHSSPSHRRRIRVSYSDDDRACSSRKPSGSQVPLKKNLAPTKRDDDRRSQEGGNADDGYDHGSKNDSVWSDLYNDEDDREKLSKVSELERETILEGRATERSDRDFTKILKKMKGQDRKGSPPKTHTHCRRSKAERADALAELVKRRRDEKMYSSDEDNKSREVPTLEEIMEITIPRSKLAQWYMEPFFNDLIVGCFVRVLIGKDKSEVPVYRLCEVLNVDATDPNRPYNFENKTTYKYLNLVWGNGSPPARWQMAVISNSPPLKVEFDQWVREIELNGGHIPTKHEVLEKMEAIQKTNSFVYSAAAVKQMLEEKKSAGWRPPNIAAEKARLRRELEMRKDDEAEVDRIKARLQDLEASRQGLEKSEKALMMVELNRRNWIANMKNASKKKPVNTNSKSSDGYDPFSRRWTRSRNYYMTSSSRGAAGHQETNVNPIGASSDNVV